METTAEETHAREGWAKDLSDEEYKKLKGARYLLRRPDNVQLNWTAILASRTDMTQIDGLQNLELTRTGGIASLGIFAGKNGRTRTNPNAQGDELFFMSDLERSELEATQAESHAEDLRKRADDAKELLVLDEARAEIAPRPSAPDYGTFTVTQLRKWALEHDIEIKMPMLKPDIIEKIEEAVQPEAAGLTL